MEESNFTVELLRSCWLANTIPPSEPCQSLFCAAPTIHLDDDDDHDHDDDDDDDDDYGEDDDDDDLW